jgi:hypothetical protein
MNVLACDVHKNGADEFIQATFFLVHGWNHEDEDNEFYVSNHFDVSCLISFPPWFLSMVSWDCNLFQLWISICYHCFPLRTANQSLDLCSSQIPRSHVVSPSNNYIIGQRVAVYADSTHWSHVVSPSNNFAPWVNQSVGLLLYKVPMTLVNNSFGSVPDPNLLGL